MIRKNTPSFLTVLVFITMGLWPANVSTQQAGGIRPSTVARIQNLELNESSSHRAAYIPAEWGKLVSVQRLDELKVQLFLQADNGEIYLVRLTQQGEYFYLDTSDKGGVVLVIKRQP
jgi:hypothetical protein